MNLFNDGVIEKDILSTPIGEKLVHFYGNRFEEEFMEKWKIATSYMPYAHPKYSSISQEGVIQLFDSEYLQVLQAIRGSGPKNLSEIYSYLSKAFIKQNKIPPEMIRKILFMKHKQLEVSCADERLQNMDLSLFGFHSYQDWFGKEFLNISAQCILNMAAEARSLGYIVTRQEARSTLFENLKNGFSLLSSEESSIEELRQAYNNQLRSLGMEESICLEIWQDILLVRKMFKEADKVVNLESSLLDKENQLALEEIHFDIYQLPSSFHLDNLKSLAKLQIYTDLVNSKVTKIDPLLPPKQMAPLSEIEKRSPELIQKKYQIDFSHVQKRDLCSAISIKDLWAWQTSDEGWRSLQSQFVFIGKAPSVSHKDRFAVLDQLSDREKDEVDRFSQSKIVSLNPKMLKDALQKMQRKQMELLLSSKGSNLPTGLHDALSLMNALDKSPILGDKNPSVEAIAAQQKLLSYTDDQENYFSITLTARDDAKRLLTFLKASDILEQLLQKRLEEAYPEARKKDPMLYQKKTGTYKNLAEAQDDLIRFAFSDLFKGIEQNYTRYFNQRPSFEMTRTSKFYTNYRCISLFREVQNDLNLVKDSAWVKNTEDKSFKREVEEQFLILKSSKDMSMLALKDSEWNIVSSLAVGQTRIQGPDAKGSLTLVHVKERNLKDKISESDQIILNNSLMQKASSFLADSLAEKICHKGCIHPLKNIGL